MAKKTVKKTKSSNQPSKAEATQRTRTRRSFPALTFEDSLALGIGIQQCAAGERVRKLTLFEHLGRSPDSSASRDLITASNQYGITTGGYQAEYLELTKLGKDATSDEIGNRQRLNARFSLAIATIEPFKALYDKFSGNKLPSRSVLIDTLRESGETDRLDECVDTFVGNAKFIGILRQIAGAERLVSIEHAVDDLPTVELLESRMRLPDLAPDAPKAASPTEWDKCCFVITPIGEEGSEERKHADLVLSSLIEPAIDTVGLKVVRADKISSPGMITSQVIEHVVKSRLVIADLSFMNPNVFYELSLRHTVAKPSVQLVRKGDRLPFDTKDFRTIVLNTENIYTLVPQLDVIKSEIANQARSAIASDEPAKNPITIFFPGIVVRLPGE